MSSQEHGVELAQAKSTVDAPNAVEDASGGKRPDNPRCVSLFILMCEFCERLGYYALTANLQMFGTNLLDSTSTASSLASLFASWNMITPLVGAYIADAKLGRYLTILILSIVYMFGLIGCALFSYPTVESAAGFYLCLFIPVAFGAGGIKPNVVTFGADQYDVTNPVQAKQQQMFFSMFYWCINIGSLVSTMYLANLAVKGSGLIPVEDGYFAVYAIAAGVFAIAISIFVSGSKYYYKKQVTESPLGKIFYTVWTAAKVGWKGQILLLSLLFLILGFILNVISVFAGGGAVAAISFFLVLTGLIGMIVSAHDPTWVSESTVEDAAIVAGTKDVVRLLPFVSFMSFFYCVYTSMSTLFITQGCYMDQAVFGTVTVSPSSFNSIGTLTIIFFIPVSELALYPAVSHCLGRKVRTLERIGMGIIMAILSMVAAGFTEIARQEAVVGDVQSLCATAKNPYTVSEYSMWNQAPEYILVGFGEIFASVAAYELFYSEVPIDIRSASTALNLLCNAFGALLNAEFVALFTNLGWYSDDINDVPFASCFFTIAGVGVIVLCAFIPFATKFEYRVEEVPVAAEGGEEQKPLKEAESPDDGSASAEGAAAKV